MAGPARRPSIGFVLLAVAAVSRLAAAQQQQQSFQIRSAAAPTIQGALNGSVQSGGGTNSYFVSINFGDVSPLNRNALVRVSVPLLLRSDQPYQLTARIGGAAMGADADRLQLSDIGLGLINVRRLANGRVCPGPHAVQSPFESDPALVVNRTRRATYPATLASVQNPVVIMSGPRLSTRPLNNAHGAPFNSDGWAVDVILTLVPQFFLPGNSYVAVLFELSPGPAHLCP